MEKQADNDVEIQGLKGPIGIRVLAVSLSLGNGGMDRRMEIHVCGVRSREGDEGKEGIGKLSQY